MRGKSTKLSRGINNDFCINTDDFRSNRNVQTYCYKLTKGKKSITVSWSKIRGIKGYQIEIATDKKFKINKKTVKMKKQNRYTQKNNCININC